MENLLKNLEDLRERVNRTWKLLDLDRKAARAEELKHEMNLPGFWDDQEKAVRVSKKVEELEKEVRAWEGLSGKITDLEELVALAQKEGDASIDEDAHKQYQILEKQFAKMEFYVFFSGQYDEHNAVVSIHAGTGGVDAQDWAEILLRMYLRFAEKMAWRAEVMDRTAGNEAGIKSAVIHVNGRYAYGYLRSEAGTHRLVRISPFDAEAMRHTSFALVEVIPELPEAHGIELKDEDLKIDVFRSSGPGGQSVNTTDSAVRVKHLPTGITVQCQNERSQHQNKENALKILKAKLFKHREEERQAKEDKLRGQAGAKAEWGKQIRSYVMQPYKMAKDHRTDYEEQDVDAVLDGNLEGFMEAYLRYVAGESSSD